MPEPAVVIGVSTMPTYRVKPDSLIEHEGKSYPAGSIIELPSNLGAFHEPNIMTVLPKDDNLEDEDEDEDEDDNEEERGETLSIIVAA